MAKIKLTKGKYAIVDDNNYNELSKHKWWYTTRGYAVREENGKVVFMHRHIMKTPNGFDTDHINRDKLDNRKENLRIVTRSENFMNLNPRKNNKSGIIGVQKAKNSWMARIKVGYKSIYLGTFKKFEDAVRARRIGELKYHKICPISQ